MGDLRELHRDAAAERAVRVDLAAAFRLAVRLEMHEGVCNHFSAMLGGQRFLLNRYGLHWIEVTASNLLALDAGGRLLKGEGEYEKTAFYIHSRIHLAHPRAACVLHTHMPYATSLTLLENGRLEMVEQNALRFPTTSPTTTSTTAWWWTRPKATAWRARSARNACCSSPIMA